MQGGTARLQHRDELLHDSPWRLSQSEVPLDETPDIRSNARKLAARNQKEGGWIETSVTANPLSKHCLGKRPPGALQYTHRGLVQLDPFLQRRTCIAETPHQPSDGHDL